MPLFGELVSRRLSGFGSAVKWTSGCICWDVVDVAGGVL